MYIFIAIIFIAELIIALQLILLITKLDKRVCDINECVKTFNPLAKTCMEYIRCLTSQFCTKVSKSIEFVKKQREKIIMKTIITVSIYSLLFIFKFKKIKAKKINKLLGAIRDVAVDLAV